MKTGLPDTIVLAGGLGTRLQSVIKNIPKPMAPIAGKPFLYWLLNYVSKYKPSKFILSTGYMNNAVQDFFGKSFNNIQIVYCNEDEPLGTGGAIKKALGYCETENCMIINGDTLFEIDYHSFFQFHINEKNDFTIALKELESPERYGTVTTDGTTVKGFREKNSNLKKGMINAGIYLLNKSIVEYLPDEEKFSFEKDFLEKMVTKLKLNGFVSNGYFIDIGIPEDYKKANNEFPKLFN